MAPKRHRPVRGCSMVAPQQSLHQFLPFLGRTRFCTSLALITSCVAQAMERTQIPTCPCQRLRATTCSPRAASPVACRDVLLQPQPGCLPLHLETLNSPPNRLCRALALGGHSSHALCVYIYVGGFFFFAGAMDLDSQATGQPVALDPCPPRGHHAQADAIFLVPSAIPEEPTIPSSSTSLD